MTKIKTLLIIFILLLTPCFAKNPVNVKAKVCHEISVYKDTPGIIEFVVEQNLTVSFVDIPENSTVKAEIKQFLEEKRFHKHAFIMCKLLSYTTPEGDEIDIKDRNVYIYLRKHEPVNKKEAAIIASEFVATTGASFFAPGVDVGYYFIKGAILREKHPNWFRAGVSNYWDNSIFWLFEKGKTFDLISGDEIKLFYTPEIKARNKIAKITYKKHKKNFKKEKKIVKEEVRKILAEEKAEREKTIIEKEVDARISDDDDNYYY